MAAALVITFRETLEASLVVVIVLTVLQRMRQERLRITMWHGVAAGVGASLLVAIILHQVFGGLSERGEEIAEGIVMLLAAGLITWMILWMGKMAKGLRQRIESDTLKHVDQQSALGIFLMSFLAVFREGTETVLFLQASVIQAQSAFQGVGAIAGITIALGLSFLLYRGFRSLPLKWVFRSTSILLILFAAGLVAHGLHELQEAGLVAFGSRVLWDINPAALADGSYPWLHDHGLIGGTLRALVGYTGTPTVLEISAYAMYLASVFGLNVLLKNREMVKSEIVSS